MNRKGVGQRRLGLRERGKRRRGKEWDPFPIPVLPRCLWRMDRMKMRPPPTHYSCKLTHPVPSLASFSHSNTLKSLLLLLLLLQLLLLPSLRLTGLGSNLGIPILLPHLLLLIPSSPPRFPSPLRRAAADPGPVALSTAASLSTGEPAVGSHIYGPLPSLFYKINICSPLSLSLFLCLLQFLFPKTHF